MSANLNGMARMPNTRGELTASAITAHPEKTEAEIAAMIDAQIKSATDELTHALVELIWGCENGDMRPWPAYEDARRILGDRDPLRHIRGPIED